jgi:eukaryotic-like serine/threonine-protein kinase
MLSPEAVAHTPFVMDWKRVKIVFAEAAGLESGAERAAYLDRACAGDTALRGEVEAMLAAQVEAGDFLENPILGTENPEPAEIIGARIGPYRIVEPIGEGGFGTVYLAEQEAPIRRRVALKVIKAGMDTKAVIARFEAERQALALMNHPNIAKVLDAGTTASGRPYFVMELVPGIKITEYCTQAALSTEARLRLFIPVCHAVQHAHQKGIIHRDLKPSNVLVILENGVPVPKVIDFGIAKATGDQRLTDGTVFTALGQFLGTPAYMSPEQVEMGVAGGGDLDTRTDIYGLGVLLYEVLTGATPFDTQDLARAGPNELRRIIRENEPLRPSTRLKRLRQKESAHSLVSSQAAVSPVRSKIGGRKSEIETDLDWIVMKCLEKDRTRRYETANGLAADLKRYLNNEPVVARPPSRWYEFQKTVRRHKFGFAATAAVILALVIGLGAASVMFVRERAARSDERQQRIAAQAAQQAAEAERQRANDQARKAIESELFAGRMLYVAHIKLAHQSLRLNNLGRARRLLDHHRPKPGEEELAKLDQRTARHRSNGIDRSGGQPLAILSRQGSLKMPGQRAKSPKNFRDTDDEPCHRVGIVRRLEGRLPHNTLSGADRPGDLPEHSQ